MRDIAPNIPSLNQAVAIFPPLRCVPNSKLLVVSFSLVSSSLAEGHNPPSTFPWTAKRCASQLGKGRRH